jgi:hypothetical protein
MSQFSQIVAATFDKVSNAKNKAANQWSQNATLNFMEAKGGLKRESGGPQLEFTLDTIVNPDAAFLASDVSPTSVTKTEVLDAVKYDWALFVAPINWTILDEAKNSGEKKVDLVTSLVDNALESHDDKFEAAMFAASATNGFLSYPLLMVEAATGIIGGIDSGTDTYWANATEDYGTDLHLGMNILYAECAKGSGGMSPDLLVTGSTVWATYADSLQANFQFQNVAKVNAGINTKTTKLHVIKEFYRQRRAEIELPNAASMSMKVVSVAQLATDNRSRNGVCWT